MSEKEYNHNNNNDDYRSITGKLAEKIHYLLESQEFCIRMSCHLLIKDSEKRKKNLAME